MNNSVTASGPKLTFSRKYRTQTVHTRITMLFILFQFMLLVLQIPATCSYSCLSHLEKGYMMWILVKR